MKRAVLYARFSSDLQKDQSIDDQFALCRGLAEREKLTVIATYRDRAMSGASMFDRDGLIELMKAAKQQKFEAVIVESLDRLSRDQEDLAGIFKRLDFNGVKIITSDGVTTPMHVGIRGLLGSMFLTDLGNKVRRGHDGRVREGKFPGAVVYGYRRILGKPGEREIDPKQAETVRRIFQEYAAGKSPRQIAIDLTKDGIPTPAGAPAWNSQSFVGGRYKRGIIGNPIYIGKIVWNTHRTARNPDTGSISKRATKAKEHITASVPHLRIVDQTLWDAANKVRQDRAVAKFGPDGKVQRKKFISHKEHLLGGLLRCAVCGGHMRVAQVSRNGGARVACAAAHQHGTCKHTRSYDLGTLTAGVLDGIRDKLLDRKMIAEAMSVMHARLASGRKKQSTETKNLRQQFNRAQVQIDRLVDAIASTTQPVQELVKRLDALEIERVSLQERLRLLEAESNVIRLHPRAVDTYKSNMERLHQMLTASSVGITPEARAAFRMVFDSIVVHPTSKRMPYEFSPYARIGAILGVDMFPAKRSAKEILAESGVSCADVATPENSEVAPSVQVITLGRWKNAA